MNRPLDAILEDIAACYRAVLELSDWNRLNAIDSLDKANEAIDRRDGLLKTLEDLRNESETTAGPGALSRHPRYTELSDLCAQIREYDALFMKKMSDRMGDIKTQLKNQALFRCRALPSYTRQKLALAR